MLCCQYYKICKFLANFNLCFQFAKTRGNNHLRLTLKPVDVTYDDTYKISNLTTERISRQTEQVDENLLTEEMLNKEKHLDTKGSENVRHTKTKLKMSHCECCNSQPPLWFSYYIKKVIQIIPLYVFLQLIQ